MPIDQHNPVALVFGISPLGLLKQLGGNLPWIPFHGRVKTNKESPGIDGVRIADFESCLDIEPLFSEHSYGLRPGRNQRQPSETTRQIVAG